MGGYGRGGSGGKAGVDRPPPLTCPTIGHLLYSLPMLVPIRGRA